MVTIGGWVWGAELAESSENVAGGWILKISCAIDIDRLSQELTCKPHHHAAGLPASADRITESPLVESIAAVLALTSFMRAL